MLILTAVQNLVHNLTIMEWLFRAASSEETFAHMNSLGVHIYTRNVYVYITTHTTVLLAPTNTCGRSTTQHHYRYCTVTSYYRLQLLQLLQLVESNVINIISFLCEYYSTMNGKGMKLFTENMKITFDFFGRVIPYVPNQGKCLPCNQM